MSVAAMKTHTGEYLVLRSDPTEREVLGFIEEHNRRYHAGEPGGFNGDAETAAFLIKEAKFFEDEDDIGDDSKATKELDISKLL